MNSEPFVSHATNHEDVVLARALRPDERIGFWVDVGAGDPVVDSVTAAFSQRGWCGINVEPLRPEFERLTGARPHDVNLNVALGETSGRAELFAGPSENRGSSTLVPELAARYRSLGQSFTPVEVEVSTLKEIVSEHVSGDVDFLKVDVEGFEREVLAGAEWSTFRPRVVLVEATVPNTAEPSHEAWEPILLSAGYELTLFDGLNRFYVCKGDRELTASLSAPANVLDCFVNSQSQRELAEANARSASLEASLDEATASLQSLKAALDELERVHHALRDVEHPRAITEAETAWSATRRLQDHCAILEEEVARMNDDLARAELRQADVHEMLAQTTEAARRLSRELAALRATRMYRYANPLRNVYGALRHLRD